VLTVDGSWWRRSIAFNLVVVVVLVVTCCVVLGGCGGENENATTSDWAVARRMRRDDVRNVMIIKQKCWERVIVIQRCELQ